MDRRRNRSGFLAAALVIALQGGLAMAAELPNLFSNASLEADTQGRGLPDGCATWAPWEAITPVFTWDAATQTGRRSLKIESAGKPGCYGRWEVRVDGIAAGRWYRVAASARTEGIADVDRCVGVTLSWLGAGGPKELFHGRRGWNHVGVRADSTGGGRRFERVVQAPEGAETLRVDLVLRWTEKGAVWFDDLAVREAPAPESRPVRIAVNGVACTDRTPLGAARFWAGQIARMAEGGLDLAVLPEYGAGPAYDDPRTLLACSTPVPGPATEIVAAQARASKTLVVYNLLENDRDVLYNTSVLFDRDGRIVGRFRKVHLAIFEEWAGITPGRELPVFDTEIGRIGMMICWDNRFPESARVLAAQGAEIIALSTAANYHGLGIDRRAEDNAVVIAEANTSGRQSCIVNIDGAILDVVEARKPFARATVDLAARTRVPDRAGFDDFRSRIRNERRPEAYGPLAAPFHPGGPADL